MNLLVVIVMSVSSILVLAEKRRATGLTLGILDVLQNDKRDSSHDGSNSEAKSGIINVDLELGGIGRKAQEGIRITGKA